MAKCNIKTTRRCEKGFIEEYIKFSRHLECPPDYNLWNGISLVACALARNCWTTKGYAHLRIFPNLYLLLVGPSAVGKGISMGASLNLLLEAFESKVPLYAQRGTVESLIQFLAKQTEEVKKSDCFIHVPEFATFIGKANLDPSILHVLTDYYDCPDYRTYSTRAHGDEVMHKLCINMQAGSTPEWIKSSLPEDSIGGGFLSRLVIVNRYEPGERKAFPQIDSSVMLSRDKCVNDLRLISQIEGEFQWEDDAKDYYAQWYEEYMDIQRKEAGPNLDGYYGRKGTLIIKLAMISSASFEDTKTICEADIEWAMKILGENEQYQTKLVENLSQTETGKMINKVRNMIAKDGVVIHSKILRSLSRHATSTQIKEMIETLAEGNEIKVKISGRTTFYEWVTESEQKAKQVSDEKNEAKKEGEKKDEVPAKQASS